MVLSVILVVNDYNFRYMYIPLGGSQRKLLNVWVIFTFVAIWHDLEWYSLLSLCFLLSASVVLYLRDIPF